MKLEDLKALRTGLMTSEETIKLDWENLGIDYDHYLAESLADLTIKLEEVTNLVNQCIGELT